MLMSRATLPYEIKIMNFNFSSSLEWQLKLEFMRLRGKEGIWSFHNGKKKKRRKRANCFNIGMKNKSTF